MAAWSKNVHPDTGELYIDLGEDKEGYTRYVWFAGDMEVYDKADFETADKMAAAPELLEALKEIVAWYERHDGGEKIGAARKAIAKAESRP